MGNLNLQDRYEKKQAYIGEVDEKIIRREMEAQLNEIKEKLYYLGDFKFNYLIYKLVMLDKYSTNDIARILEMKPAKIKNIVNFFHDATVRHLRRKDKND